MHRTSACSYVRWVSVASLMCPLAEQVLKRKLQEGSGMFPVDAPVQDATVTVRYSLHHPTPDRRPGACVHNGDAEPPRVHETTFTTGEGVMPTGMEMSLKLMLPGERSEVWMHPDFGFSSCDDGEAAADAPADSAVVAVLELVSFDREGHPEVMDAAQVRPAQPAKLHNVSQSAALLSSGLCSGDFSPGLRCQASRFIWAAHQPLCRRTCPVLRMLVSDDGAHGARPLMPACPDRRSSMRAQGLRQACAHVSSAA